MATTIRKIPFIREAPLIGSIRSFMQPERLDFLLKVSQRAPVTGFHLGPIPMILFNTPDSVQHILVEHAADFDKGKVMHKAFTGNGLFISEGEFHRHQRKLLSPPFQPRHISSYAKTMVDYTEQLQQGLQENAVVDLNALMIDLTLSIIGKVLFDSDLSAEAAELGAAMAIGFAHTNKVASSLFTAPLKWPTPYNRRVQKATQEVTERFQRMIAERRSQPSTGNDFLSILLETRNDDGEPMSDAQVMDECLTLFGAGHETTAAALTWTWYYLCQHPDCYQKLQDEVTDILQDRQPTVADLSRLPYSLQVFKEAMRLYPPSAAILRGPLHEVEVDGYKLTKAMTVVISPYTLHRNPQYFPAPERFNPERFSPANEKLLPRYAYIPFGAGPRICLGNHFALMEAQLIIATMTQHLRFELLPDQDIRVDAVKNLALRPGGQVKAVVRHRS